MPSPPSVDVRERVAPAVADGASCHPAASRFAVSVSSAGRWCERFRLEGRVAPKPSGGAHTAPRIEAHADLILAACAEEPLIFLRELRDRLAEQCVSTGTSGPSRFSQRHRITRKNRRFTQLSRRAWM